MEPDDPHLIIKCSEALVTMPYFNLDTVHLIKQIIAIVVNMAHTDSAVIQKLKETANLYKTLMNSYKEIVRKL